MGNRIEVRVEARYAYRGIQASLPDDLPTVSAAVYEEFVEVPLLLSSVERVEFAERELRLILGAGLCYAVLTKQELSPNVGTGPPSELGFGDFQRLSWLLDGGLALDITRSRAVFAHFRVQRDVDTFAESNDVDVTRVYLTYGFYGGLEFGF
ncbi:MAG TPA: hypothetical protein VFT13_03265 [Candidatus Krumholzibacteria bacterium]|nr:hypothetical protein [Candidatus Krumholzibacteria bacterium]